MKLIYLLALVVMMTVANVISEVIPKCSIWRPHGRIPDWTDCTRYYQCILTIPRLTTCPKIADKQTYFDPTLELCLWSETSPCDNPTTTPGTSTPPVTVATDKTNTTPGTSTPPVTVATDKTNTTPGTSTDGSTNTPTRSPYCNDNEICTSPIKGDCKHYYQWDGDEKIIMMCGKNLYYDSIIGACNTEPYPPCAKTP